MNLLITGGAGFVGSNVIQLIINRPEIDRLVNLDCLTYAGHLRNLKTVSSDPKYSFEKIDLRDKPAVFEVVKKHAITHVMHLAAESHVDRSIAGPADFIHTNVLGTFNLLEACREHWLNSSFNCSHGDIRADSSHSSSPEGEDRGEGEPTSIKSLSSVREVRGEGKPFSALRRPTSDFRFLHVSTDEVYGSLGATGYFTETTPYAPSSPYSASKASSDMLVRSYHHTYGMPTVITNSSNNYGPFQFPEKLIPVIIQNLLMRKPVPVYGDGLNVRDWLYVRDHAEALWLALTCGKVGETYNVGGNSERTNIQIVETISDLIDEMAPELGGNSRALISFVRDRPGHDRRYAIDAAKISKELGWVPQHRFEEGIRETVRWYLDHQDWVRSVLKKTM